MNPTAKRLALLGGGAALLAGAGLVTYAVHPMTRRRHDHFDGAPPGRWSFLDTDLQCYAGVGPDFLLTWLETSPDQDLLDRIAAEPLAQAFHTTVTEPYWWPRLFFRRQIRLLSLAVPVRLDTRISPPTIILAGPLPDDPEDARSLMEAAAAQVRRWHCTPGAKPTSTVWEAVTL